MQQIKSKSIVFILPEFRFLNVYTNIYLFGYTGYARIKGLAGLGKVPFLTQMLCLGAIREIMKIGRIRGQTFLEQYKKRKILLPADERFLSFFARAEEHRKKFGYS
jgi:hypothetical protein